MNQLANLYQYLNRATFVDVSNVAQWYFDSPDFLVDWRDSFPCLLSPWDHAVFEYRYKGYGNLFYVYQGGIDDNEGFDYTDFFLSVCNHLGVRLENMQDLPKTPLGYTDDHPAYYQVIHGYLVDGCEVDILGFWLQILDKDGRSIYTPRGVPTSRVFKLLQDNGAEPHEFVGQIHILDYAISFLHCKNIELVDRPVTRQYRRKQERENKPIIRYKQLVIEPLKKQIRNENKGEGSELKRCLHICRGHFRTYTEDRPLFGKYAGNFWVPMHLKGNKGKGQINKTYKVSTEVE